MTNEEKRKFPRHPLLVEIQYFSDSPTIRARLLDVSLGGIFVDTVNPLPDGAIVKFKFPLPGESPPTSVEGEGRVAWRQHTVGMGIEFVSMSAQDSERLTAFLKTPQ